MCSRDNSIIIGQYSTVETICEQFREGWKDIRRKDKEEIVGFRKSGKENGQFNQCKTCLYGWILKTRKGIRKSLLNLFRKVQKSRLFRKLNG